MEIIVPGIPAPQGSKRHVGNGRLVESSKALRPWRQAVTYAAIQAHEGRDPFDGPLHLSCEFRFPRLSSHIGKHGLKPGAPHYKISAPDTDKLTRAICDALADAGIYRNDAQIAIIEAEKVYHDQPGVVIYIGPVL